MNKIAVIGVGKLGLCFSLNLERAGFEVWGIDLPSDYLRKLEDRSFMSSEPMVTEMLKECRKLHFSADLNCITEHDITDLFLMVATPSTPDGGYDHSQIERAVEGLKQLSGPRTTRNLYIGCTTMPGYCKNLAQRVKPYQFTVTYNPEFIAQGAIIHGQLYPDQVLIGEADTQVGDRLQGIYSKMVRSEPIYCRMDSLSAEIAKLATNCFLTTKISFANSVGDLAIKAGANPHHVLSAVGADSRIGTKYLGYGYGFGGPCFPRDNRALGKFGDELNYPLHLSKATDRVNEEHYHFQLAELLIRYPMHSEVTFEGVAYKKGTSQLTESQQLRMAVAMAQLERKVIIKDIPEVIAQLEVSFPGLFTYEPIVASST